MLRGRVDTGGRQVGGEKEGCMAGVHHAMYLLKSSYTRFSDCFYLLTLSCTFFALGNVAEVSFI